MWARVGVPWLLALLLVLSLGVPRLMEREIRVSFPTAMVHSSHWVALSSNASYPEVAVEITMTTITGSDTS